jgi:hypothetical protein
MPTQLDERRIVKLRTLALPILVIALRFQWLTEAEVVVVVGAAVQVVVEGAEVAAAITEAAALVGDEAGPSAITKAEAALVEEEEDPGR